MGADAQRWVGFLLSPRGRVSRLPFALVYLAVGVGELVAAAITRSLLLPLLVLLVGLWPVAAVSVKRCHDRGRSGSFLLLMIVPFMLFVVWGLSQVFGPLGFILLFNPNNKIAVAVLTAAVLVSNILQFWVMGELLLLPGTRGINRFGPDLRGGFTQIGEVFDK